MKNPKPIKKPVVVIAVVPKKGAKKGKGC